MSQVCRLNKASLRIGNIERTDIAGEVERSALKRELNTTLIPEAPPYVVVPRRLLLRDPDYGRKAWKLSKYLCRVLSSNRNLLHNNSLSFGIALAEAERPHRLPISSGFADVSRATPRMLLLPPAAKSLIKLHERNEFVSLRLG